MDLAQHRAAVLACRRCATVVPPAVCSPPVTATLYALGQAPGVHEPRLGRPFAWTAGRTLFSWYARIGVSEEDYRARVYMAAVLRCFPGKARGGRGDRVPSTAEIQACRPWIDAELDLLRPRLVIAIGRLAIGEVAGRPPASLQEVVGPLHRDAFGRPGLDWVALPHPSGLSAWPKVHPGKGLLTAALETLAAHPAWQDTFGPRR